MTPSTRFGLFDSRVLSCAAMNGEYHKIVEVESSTRPRRIGRVVRNA